MKSTPETSDRNLTKHLGLVSKKQKYRYRLVDYKNERHRTDILLSQTKCNLDILPEGIMVSGDFTANSPFIAVMKNEIESISLIRGKEVIDTFLFSPMHVLSKLGVPNYIARYVSILPTEYKIGETQIIIKSIDYQLSLITDGGRYEKLLRSLKKSGYDRQLHFEEKPSMNLLNYTT